MRINIDEDDYDEALGNISDAKLFAKEIFKRAKSNGVKADADEIWHLMDRVQQLLPNKKETKQEKGNKMTIKEIREKTTPLLPEGWKIDYIDKKTGCMRLTCPIEERYGKKGDTCRKKAEKIAEKLGFKFDGGGAEAGSKRYDLFYFF